MRRVMVSYRVKPERVAENEGLVRAVYEELGSVEPDGLRYGTFRRADGVSFLHIAEMPEGENPLAGLPAFKAFLVGIGDRCDEPPATEELSEVGSYRLFEEPR